MNTVEIQIQRYLSYLFIRLVDNERKMLLLLLLEVLENGINVVKSFIDFLPDFGSSEDNFSTDKDEENNPWLDHPGQKILTLEPKLLDNPNM